VYDRSEALSLIEKRNSVIVQHSTTNTACICFEQKDLRIIPDSAGAETNALPA
jgi:hypothetical protein